VKPGKDSETEKEKEERYRTARLVGTLGSIPLLLGSGPMIGWLFGRWLDTKLGTEPWMQFVWVVLGFVAVIRSIAQMLRRAQRDLDRM